jgi:mannose-6-phosphate isomerase-like protein (cupin superfamily)
MYVFKIPKNFQIDKIGVRGKLFPTRDLIESAGIIRMDVEHGHETTIIERLSDFIYYILVGKGYFSINNIKETCKRGDLVIIPAGTPFTYKGKLQMLLICIPPWKEEQETTVDTT